MAFKAGMKNKVFTLLYILCSWAATVACQEDVSYDNKSYGDYNLPDYWLSYLDEKQKEISDIVSYSKDNCDLFLYFSDYHLVSNTCYTPFIIKFLYTKTNRIKVFNGGDIINTEYYAEDAIKIVKSFADSFADIDLYNVFGNHDSNPYGNPSSHITVNHCYPFLFSKLGTNPNAHLNDDGYYYLDNTIQKIRYIVLNTYERGFDLSNSEHLVQLNWFVDTLNNVEIGWYVVVLAHMIFDLNKDKETNTYRIIKTSSGTLISSIMDAYQTKLQGRYANYSFDFTDSKGQIACILVGHIHYDFFEQQAAGYPIISILQDAIDYPSLLGNNPPRERGTYTEQAFDIVRINTTEKTIRTVRIGAGENREFQFL